MLQTRRVSRSRNWGCSLPWCRLIAQAYRTSHHNKVQAARALDGTFVAHNKVIYGSIRDFLVFRSAPCDYPLASRV